jgi:CBS domain-containing protein
VSLLHGGVDLDENAEDHAQKSLVEVCGGRAIGYALNLMLENNIRRLVVTDDHGGFVGIVTQQDLLRQLEEDFYRPAMRVKHVRDQFRELLSVQADETVSRVLEHMVNNRIGAVPVLRNGVAVGIVTEKDVLRLANTGVDLNDPVELHMSQPVVYATWETKLMDTVKTMNECNIRRIVIADPGGRAEGMLTNRDLIRNLEGDYKDFLERKLNYTKEILNLLPEMLLEVLDTGSDNLVVWANDKVINTFGKSFLDKPVTELVPPDQWVEIHNGLRTEGRVGKGAVFYLKIPKQ